MESLLNQKLEKEISCLISIPSSYKCRDKEILKVSKVQIFLEKDYANNISEYINFSGIADFTFKGDIEGVPFYILPSKNFKGEAEVDNFTVVKVKTPIIINI